MKRITVIVMCLGAVFAFGAVAAGNALAVEYLSNQATGTFKSTGGTAELHGSVGTVVCSSNTASSTQTDAHLGKIKVVFKGCKISFFGEHICTGNLSEEPSGQISFEGEYHIGSARKSTSDTFKPGILVLVVDKEGKPNTFSFTCSGLGTVEVKGSVAGLLQTSTGAALKPGEKFTGSRVVFESSGTKALHTEFEIALHAGTIVKPKLESNLFGGGFSEAGEVATGTITETNPATLGLVEG